MMHTLAGHDCLRVRCLVTTIEGVAVPGAKVRLRGCEFKRFDYTAAAAAARAARPAYPFASSTFRSGFTTCVAD